MRMMQKVIGIFLTMAIAVTPLCAPAFADEETEAIQQILLEQMEEELNRIVKQSDFSPLPTATDDLATTDRIYLEGNSELPELQALLENSAFSATMAPNASSTLADAEDRRSELYTEGTDHYNGSKTVIATGGNSKDYYYKFSVGMREVTDLDGWTASTLGEQQTNEKVNAWVKDWPIHNGSNILRIYDAFWQEGNNCANMDVTYNFGTVDGTASNGIVSVSFGYIQEAASKQSRIELKSGSDLLGYIYVNPSVNCGLSFVAADSEGVPQTTDLVWGTQNDNGQYLEKGRYYNIEFQMDFANQTIGVLIDDQLKASGSFLTQNIESVDSLHFTTENNSEAVYYIGDIQVKAGDTTVATEDFSDCGYAESGWYLCIIAIGSAELYDAYGGEIRYDPVFASENPDHVSLCYLDDQILYIDAMADLRGHWYVGSFSFSKFNDNHLLLTSKFYSGMSKDTEAINMTEGLMWCDVTAENISSIPKTAMIIVCLYDEDDEELADVRLISKTIEPNSSESFSVAMNVPSSSHKFKIMAWDEEMNQAADSVYFPLYIQPN